MVWYLLRANATPRPPGQLCSRPTPAGTGAWSPSSPWSTSGTRPAKRDPLPLPDYQVVRAAMRDPGNLLDLVPVTQQTILRYEAVAHPS